MPIFIQKDYTGGIAEGSKRGYKGSVQDAIAIDYRSDPDKLKVLPRLVKISGTTVTGLPKWGKEFNSLKFVYDSDGKLYSINNSDTVTLLRTVSGSSGQGMEIFNDELWYASATKIGKVVDPTGTPSYNDDYFTTPQYESPDYAQAASASNTYTLPTSVNEDATHKLDFTTTVDSVNGLTVNVVDKGTGNWTFTLHDSSNNVLATVTVDNADITNGLNRITLPSVIAVTTTQTYHWHIYVSTGTSTLRASTANDLTTAEGAVWQYLDNLELDQSSEPSVSTMVVLPNAYSVPTAISESSTAMREFTPELSTLKGIAILIQDRGTTADWTLTVHNQFNTTIGTATLTNANIKQRGTWVTFIFTNALELTPGLTYHFHLTATNTTGTPDVITSTASDLSTAYYRTYSAILDTDSDYHPMKRFLNLLCVGHGNKLLTIDDAESLEIEALVFPKGEKVRSLETIGDYLSIVTWRGSSISDFGTSRVYMWDGTSPTFNAFLDIDGQTNAVVNDSNKLALIHGTQVNISYYTGGVTKMRRLKNLGNNITAEVLPGAIAIYEGIMHFGLTNASSNSIDTCVYSYGRLDKDYPYSLGKDYTISTGDKDNTVQIGMLLAVGIGKFYVGWKRGSSAGIDKIDITKKQQYAEFITMRYDDNNPNLEKELTGVSLRFDPLHYDVGMSEYEKITLQYRYNNEATWIPIGTVDPLNETSDRDILYKSFAQPENTRWFEVEWRVIMESNVDTNVENIILTMEFERLDEFQIGTIASNE